MLGVIFVTAKGIGNVNVGATDVFVIRVAYDRLYVCGDLAATVKFIPGYEKLCLLAFLFKSLTNKQGSCDIPEISYMNASRGRNARRADKFFFFGILLYQSFCNFF